MGLPIVVTKEVSQDFENEYAYVLFLHNNGLPCKVAVRIIMGLVTTNSVLAFLVSRWTHTPQYVLQGIDLINTYSLHFHLLPDVTAWSLLFSHEAAEIRHGADDSRRNQRVRERCLLITCAVAYARQDLKGEKPNGYISRDRQGPEKFSG